MEIRKGIKSLRGCKWKVEQEGINPQSVHTLHTAQGGAMDNFITVGYPQIWNSSKLDGVLALCQ